jgi:hypothetical protein
MKFFKTLITEKDNATLCHIRIIALLASMASIGFALHQEFIKGAVDILAFCQGQATILGASGVGTAIKSYAGGDTPS